MKRGIEDVKYERLNMPKHIEKWINRMQKTLDAMPKNTFLSADGNLHYFSKYKDGSIFKDCTKSKHSTEANDCLLHSFRIYCEGGDFW